MQYAENESIDKQGLAQAVAGILHTCQFCGTDTRITGKDPHIAKFTIHRCEFRRGNAN